MQDLIKRLDSVIAELVETRGVLRDNDTYDFDAGGYIGSLEHSAEGLLGAITEQATEAGN